MEKKKLCLGANCEIRKERDRLFEVKDYYTKLLAALKLLVELGIPPPKELLEKIRLTVED